MTGPERIRRAALAYRREYDAARMQGPGSLLLVTARELEYEIGLHWGHLSLEVLKDIFSLVRGESVTYTGDRRREAIEILAASALMLTETVELKRTYKWG